MRGWTYLIIGVVLTFSGCNKDCDEIPEEPKWKRFEGQYHVTKLENGETYNMRIYFDSLLHQPSNETHLYIIYENFDNSFDSLAGFYIENSNPNRIRDFSAPHGVGDKNDDRWALWMKTQDTTTIEPENTLVNDTILFYFQKSNIAFYFEDGVPFYECECKHLAVKIE